MVDSLHYAKEVKGMGKVTNFRERSIIWILFSYSEVHKIRYIYLPTLLKLFNMCECLYYLQTLQPLTISSGSNSSM